MRKKGVVLISELIHNLFKYATSELSHSAYWAWIISSLQVPDQQDLAGPRRIAQRIFDYCNINKPDPPLEVDTEVQHDEAPNSRIDVLVRSDDKPVVAIENKVQALISVDQVERYRDALGCDVICFSTSFDVGRDLPEYYLDLDALIEISEVEAASHPLVADHVEWMKQLKAERKQLYCLATSGSVESQLEALSRAEGQWYYMQWLTDCIDGSQYRGTSHGRPWTQLRFYHGHNRRDSLFYRIDKYKKGYYVSLRQYQKPPQPSWDEKERRRDQLRQIWQECFERVSPSLDRNKPNNRGKNESEIACFLVHQQDPKHFKKGLSKLHEAFVEALIDQGWSEGHFGENS